MSGPVLHLSQNKRMSRQIHAQGQHRQYDCLRCRQHPIQGKQQQQQQRARRRREPRRERERTRPKEVEERIGRGEEEEEGEGRQVLVAWQGMS